MPLYKQKRDAQLEQSVEMADVFVNVVFATQWNLDPESVSTKTIPWEITFSNRLNPKETFILIPSPESVLTMGLVYMHEPDDSFAPRYYQDPYYLSVHLNRIENFVVELTQPVHPRAAQAIKIMHSWDLASKTIGVLNDASMQFMKKYFPNVINLTAPIQSGRVIDDINLSDCEIPEDFDDVKFVENLLEMLEKDETSQAKQVLKQRKKQPRKIRRLRKIKPRCALL